MKALAPEALARHHRDGFCFPLRVLSAEERLEYRARLEAVEGAPGRPLGGLLRQKCHLLFTWLDALIRHPRILDTVEDVLGPDLLCWGSSFFIKEARDEVVLHRPQHVEAEGGGQPGTIGCGNTGSPRPAVGRRARTLRQPTAVGPLRQWRRGESR